MALVLADRVLETTAVAGTGDAALAGAVLGYQPFSTIGGGNTTYYTIVAIDDNGAPTGDWEVGIGTYITTGNKISRDTVLSSSNGGALVYFASGTKQIFLDLPSEEVLLTAGDVNGPASAVSSNFALFDGTTGKLLKDAGINASTFATAAQGALADTAVQPGSLGTAAYLDAGVANGVATLDAGGKVPVSQIPALGDLNYQGTWNASTNTPTLTSSAGTKGFYYVVSVAGTTNLNGITDWQVGDWAVFNGSVWQKIDNTDLVTSVNGYTGTVNLTYTDVGAFPATATSGTGSVVLNNNSTITGLTLVSPTTFTPTTAPSYAKGLLWYDSTNEALSYYNDATNNAVHIGQETIVKVINNTGTTIPFGSPVYITSTSSGQTYPNVALAKADVISTAAVIGITNTAITNGAIGYVVAAGMITNINTSAFTVGDVLYLSPYSAGQLMNTVPPTGYVVQVGVCAYGHASQGAIYTKQTTPLAISANTLVGQVPVANGGTGQSSYTNGQLLIGNTTGNTLVKATLTAGTGIGISNGAGSITVTNSAPDQTVVLTGAGTTTVTGTYPSFTITSNDAYTGTVTSVSGTSPISVATGTTTPVVSMTQANTSTNGYLTSTDWNTFNSKQPAGSYLTTVTADAPLSGSGTSGSHLVISQSNTSTNGYLSSTDWNTFNGKLANPMTTLGDVIYGAASGTATRLAGNTTTAKQFLSQTGTGSVSAAPAWSALPTVLPVLNRAGSTVSVSVGNGVLPVLNRSGSTVNVAIN